MLFIQRKLIVGHNMVLDLLHTIDKFLTPLPEDYEEFKECAHCFFPMVLDTKYLSGIEPFNELISSSVLGHLLETLNKSPFSVPNVGKYTPFGKIICTSNTLKLLFQKWRKLDLDIV